jgi:hypothetical protein
MGDKLMTVPNVKTAMVSDEVGVIDALRLAFAADPAVRWIWPDPQGYLHISLPLPEPLEEKRLQIRAPTTLGTILVQLFGFRQMFTLMLTS